MKTKVNISLNSDTAKKLKRLAETSNMNVSQWISEKVWETAKKNEGIVTDADIKDYQKRFMGSDNILFGTVNEAQIGLRLKDSLRNHNVFVTGAAATGKSYSYMWSNLLLGNHSAIVADPLSCTARRRTEELRRKGYKVYWLDFTNPEKSSRYNPFLHFNDNFTEKDLSDLIYNIFVKSDEIDPFYDMINKILLNVAVTYTSKSSKFKDEDRTFATMYHVIEEIGNNRDKLKEYDIDSIFGNNCTETVFLCSEENYQKAVKTLTRLQLAPFLFLNLFKCFEEREDTDNIDINTLVNGQGYLFYGSSDYSVRWENTAIISLLTELFMQDAFACASKRTSEHHLQFYLDEFSSYGAPNIVKYLRKNGYGIGISVITQLQEQLELRYGKVAEQIPKCCDTKIYMGTILHSDVKEISETTNLDSAVIEDIFNSGKEIVKVTDVYPFMCDKLEPLKI